MLLRVLTVAVSLLGLSCAADSVNATTITVKDERTVKLYAYGINISGVSVFYGDGLAYIGNVKPDWLNEVSNITFNTNLINTTIPWTINSVEGVFTNGSYEMYIVPTNGSFEQVGFVSTNAASSNNATLPPGAVTTGFGYYGSLVNYVASDSDWEAKFWGVSTNTTGVWELLWNGGTTDIPVASTPIILKRVGVLPQT